MKIAVVFIGALILLAMHSSANAAQNLARDRLVRPVPQGSSRPAPAYQGPRQAPTVINNHTTIINNRSPVPSRVIIHEQRVRERVIVPYGYYHSSYYYAGLPPREVDVGAVVTGFIGGVIGGIMGQRLVPATPVVVVPPRYIAVPQLSAYVYVLPPSPPPPSQLLKCSYPGSSFEVFYTVGTLVPTGMVCVSY